MGLDRRIYDTGRCKVKLNAKQKRALQEHENWLRSKGLHKDQLKKKPKVKEEKDTVKEEKPTLPKTSDKVGNGFRTGILDKLHLEPEEVRKKIIEKTKRVESLYSKGPLQYVTDGTNVQEIGTKSRRL